MRLVKGYRIIDVPVGIGAVLHPIYIKEHNNPLGSFVYCKCNFRYRLSVLTFRNSLVISNKIRTVTSHSMNIITELKLAFNLSFSSFELHYVKGCAAKCPVN